MKNYVLQIIIFVFVSLLFAFWAMGMTASGPDTLKFYLIYVPLLLFLFSEFYFIHEAKKSTKKKLPFRLISFVYLPVALLLFLFLSFGVSKNKICIEGNCENGNGVALYIQSERTSKSGNEWNEGEYTYYEPEFLGRNFYNNITWYDGNPIEYIYKGDFKNGKFHNEGEYFWFTHDYDAEPFHYKYPIDGVYLVGGEWERGWLLWEKDSRYNGHIELNENEIYDLRNKFNLDPMGYYIGK